jgi:hypothetical protein
MTLSPYPFASHATVRPARARTWDAGLHATPCPRAPAIDIYWEIRRLPLVVSVINQPSHDNSLCTEVDAVDMKSSHLLICSSEMKLVLVNSDEPAESAKPAS